eukprot:c39390_g1_i1.p1 GENE.c39390_g1_i1~~c39390_g1_i1.p1  ORF type:complete len:272 (+),score=38.46 c39390_g1_i1:60-875(+)
MFRSLAFRFPKEGLLCAVAGSASYFLTSKTSCDDSVHPPHLHWSHHGVFSSFDAASIRRGHQVYQQVCASCHGVSRVAYRNLVNVCYTEDEVKLLLEDVTVEDGPNDQGVMFERPAKLFDYMRSPYKNEGEARLANGGALPPDLSLIVKARHGFEDYIFSILTGYREEPPAGITLRQGLYFNPYFPGGAIAMPPPLMDGAVEFEDGTPATASQMAKDVTTFLAWCAEPEHDQRKKMGVQWIVIMGVAAVLLGYMKRFRWAPIKTRKIEFRK